MSRWLLLLCGAVMVAACGERASEVADPRPQALHGTALKDVGSMCFIERVNQKPVRALPTFRTQDAVVFQGWANVADGERPTPSRIHIVLRPKGGTSADAYLEMGRMPRPDLAGGDPRREMIGFEGEGRLPAVGTYDVLVSQSDADWESICRTGIVLGVGP